jgi:hypothetical protein
VVETTRNARVAETVEPDEPGSGSASVIRSPPDSPPLTARGDARAELGPDDHRELDGQPQWDRHPEVVAPDVTLRVGRQPLDGERVDRRPEEVREEPLPAGREPPDEGPMERLSITTRMPTTREVTTTTTAGTPASRSSSAASITEGK